MSIQPVKYNRDYIRERLISFNTWLICDIDIVLSNVYSTRLIIRKHLNEKPINDMLLVNNVIGCNNILGFFIAKEVFKKVLTDEEMQYLNAVNQFLGFETESIPYNEDFLNLLRETLTKYKKGA